MDASLFRKGLLVGVSLAVGVGGCTPQADRPPPDPDCTPAFDASCKVGTTVGGGSSGTGTDGGVTGTTCSVNSSASQCEQCENAQCCMSIEACANSTPCNGLVFSCIPPCTTSVTSGPCIQSCESNPSFSAGVALYDDILTCVAARCPVCDESGVGDPCSAGFPACVAPLVCNGSWCVKACAVDTDCAGIGAGSDNIVGTRNVCMNIPGTGNTCVPSCSPVLGCASFVGTFCQTTTSVAGTTVQVCSFVPDGG